MAATIYDVFFGQGAQGNPSAVEMLSSWPSDTALLKRARQLAQPVTAFVCSTFGEHEVRWFSISGEINLCGHGSLAAGAALIAQTGAPVTLTSRYGTVSISKQGELYCIELPSWPSRPLNHVYPTHLLGVKSIDVFGTRDLIVVLDSAEAVENFTPNMAQLTRIEEYHAVIVTAQLGESSYVLRYFAPKIGIDEDQATGSAHCSLAPYWAKKMATQRLTARQLSNAGGYFELDTSMPEVVMLSAYVKEHRS